MSPLKVMFHHEKSTSTAKDDPDGQLYGIFGGSSDAIKSLPLAALGDVIDGQE